MGLVLHQTHGLAILITTILSKGWLGLSYKIAETGQVLTVIHNIPSDLAWLNFSQVSLLWTSAFPTLKQALSQTFLAHLTAHSKNQLTTERNTSCQTAPSCWLFIHPHFFPHLSLFPSHTHTHTQTHTDTQLLLTLLIFHVNEISFPFPFWDTLRTCVQSILPIAISSFHLFSCVRLCATPWTAVNQDSLSITNSQSLLKLKSIESPMPSNHLILCHPLLLWPSFLLSIRIFSNESVLCLRWTKYWSCSFSVSPSNE